MERIDLTGHVHIFGIGGAGMSGIARILLARGAQVPVIPSYFHYPHKIIGIGPTITLSDDMAADMARIREWYRPWQGRNRGTV